MNADNEATTVLSSIGAAIFPTLWIQAGILLIASLVLDGGLTFKCAVVAAIAYWLFVLTVVLKQPPCLGILDRWLLKWGYLFWLGIVAMHRAFLA